MKNLLLAATLGLAKVVSSDILNDLKCHDEVVREAVKVLAFPQEVESLFGSTNVDHFISRFGNKDGAAIWNSRTSFNQRYQLSLRVPIQIDYVNCRLIGATGSATIRINEVTKVDISRSGIAGATLNEQWRLNENEWKWLVNKHGDWSAVGVPIISNAPVSNFQEYIRQIREPVRNRKEGFDDKIRDAIHSISRKRDDLPSEVGEK